MNIGTKYEYCWWRCYETGHEWISERNTSTAVRAVTRLVTDEYRNGIRVLLMVCYEADHGWISEGNTIAAVGAVTRLVTDEYWNGIRVLLLALLRGLPRMNIGTEYEYCCWRCYEAGHGWISERNTDTANGAVNRTGSVVQDSDWDSKNQKIKR